VDRVIHNRGQVASESREKIQKIIEELNYTPNILARTLASKKSLLFVILIPTHKKGTGEYWDGPLEGIQKAWQEIADFNVILKTLYFDQFNVESYREKISEMLSMNPDGVIVTPVFNMETQKLTDNLDKNNIPYVFMDSTVDGLNNLAFFGQNSFQSGFLAAKLLENGLAENSKIATLKPAGSAMNQVNVREEGFYAYFKQKAINKKYTFCSGEYDSADEKKREKQISDFLNKNQPTAAIVFNSRVFEIARIIEKLNLQNIKLIGYDLIKENESFLRKGIVSFLIAQRPEVQGYLSVMSIFNYLSYKKEISKDNFMPIDILTKENLDYYINFTK
jgi:LacI family transcriptional regulator